MRRAARGRHRHDRPRREHRGVRRARARRPRSPRHRRCPVRRCSAAGHDQRHTDSRHGARRHDSLRRRGRQQAEQQLTGDVTVAVVKRLPNGNLSCAGRSGSASTRDSEYMRIQGVVRPIDIQPDNSIDVHQGRQRVDLVRRQGRGRGCQRSRAGWRGSSIHRWTALLMPPDFYMNTARTSPVLRCASC